MIIETVDVVVNRILTFCGVIYKTSSLSDGIVIYDQYTSVYYDRVDCERLQCFVFDTFSKIERASISRIMISSMCVTVYGSYLLIDIPSLPVSLLPLSRTPPTL